MKSIFSKVKMKPKQIWGFLIFILLSAVISTAFMVLAPFLIGKVTTAGAVSPIN